MDKETSDKKAGVWTSFKDLLSGKSKGDPEEPPPDEVTSSSVQSNMADPEEPPP